MDSQKVDMFLMANSKFFEAHHLNAVRETLLQMDDAKWACCKRPNLKIRQPALSFLYWQEALASTGL